jgi:Tol biopolymer transport system component
MVIKQSPPNLGALERQLHRQRRSTRNRKIGAIVLVAAVVVTLTTVVLVSSPNRGTGPADVSSTTTTPPESGVYLIDLSTGDTTLVPDIHATGSTISVSPDGAMVTYVGDDTNGAQVVYVASIDGANIRLLGRTGSSAYMPRWSPDSATIVYEQIEPVGNLFLVDVATGRTTQLTDFNYAVADFWAEGPTYSPDGQTILFNRVPNGKDVSDLWSVPVSGGQPTLVRRDAAFGSFSPDGSRITYVRERTPPVGDLKFRGLWLARADGSGAFPLLVRGHIHIPRWSPDGSKIAYMDDRRNGTISVIGADTGATTVVADFGAFPDWVNDHTLIVDMGD